MMKVTTVHYEPPVRVLDGWNMEIKGIETKIEVEEGDMKKEDVLKALECCGDNGDCEKCPYFKNEHYLCGKSFNTDVLDLINRQKAEIEALIAGQETLQKYRDEEINRLEIELKAMRGAANSYKAEIERLQDKLDTARREMLETIPLIEEDIKIAKAEAVKEFAERLKVIGARNNAGHILFVEKNFDNLVKEMVGDTK